MPDMLSFGGGEISSHQRQLCTEQVHVHVYGKLYRQLLRHYLRRSS